MYLQGKLNQNAHITLRAPEYWQQLNLSVKNLVKELKTFELPVSKMIQPSRVLRIFMASASCCCCYCLYTWISFSFLFFKHAALCSAVLVFVLAASFMHGYAWIFLSDVHVNVYMHAGVCQQKKKILCVQLGYSMRDRARGVVRARKGLSASGRELAMRTIAMFVD